MEPFAGIPLLVLLDGLLLISAEEVPLDEMGALFPLLAILGFGGPTDEILLFEDIIIPAPGFIRLIGLLLLLLTGLLLLFPMAPPPPITALFPPPSPLLPSEARFRLFIFVNPTMGAP